MNESDSTHFSVRRWFQWKLSTWFVLVAILCWAFAISPRQIVFTDTVPFPGGKTSVNTLTYMNPHYFGPVAALSAFMCWKEIASLPGFGKMAFRRRAKRLAFGLSMFASVVAVGALCASFYYGSAADVPGAGFPESWARMMAADSSMVFYSSAGLAIGLIAALVLSAADQREPVASL